MTQTQPAPRPFDGAVFDLDGTLIDTEVICNETGVEACANLGHHVTLAFFEGLAGVDDFERARRIEREVGHPVDPQAFIDEWDRLCAIRFQDGIPMKEGALALLDALADLGVPMALCTSSRRSQAELKLTHTGLGRYFAATITLNEVSRAKPDPEPYRTAAEALGFAPARCVAFEDSETGARSAFAAGMHVVQTPDLQAATGDYAHHVADKILDGARAVGLLAA